MDGIRTAIAHLYTKLEILHALEETMLRSFLYNPERIL